MGPAEKMATIKSHTKRIDLVALADRLKKVRESLGLSQMKMIDMIGGDSKKRNPLWRQYELGTTEPGAGVIAKLCLLGFDANWILTGEGSMLRTDGPLEHNPTVVLKFRQFLAAVIDVSTGFDKIFKSNE